MIGQTTTSNILYNPMSTTKKKGSCSKSEKKCKSEVSLGERLTTVNTTYARVALLLLAVNFALTGYAVYSITQIQSAAMSPDEAVTSEVDAQIASTGQ